MRRTYCLHAILNFLCVVMGALLSSKTEAATFNLTCQSQMSHTLQNPRQFRFRLAHTVHDASSCSIHLDLYDDTANLIDSIDLGPGEVYYIVSNSRFLRAATVTTNFGFFGAILEVRRVQFGQADSYPGEVCNGNLRFTYRNFDQCPAAVSILVDNTGTCDLVVENLAIARGTDANQWSDPDNRPPDYSIGHPGMDAPSGRLRFVQVRCSSQSGNCQLSVTITRL
jgi:hypothetical protein